MSEVIERPAMTMDQMARDYVALRDKKAAIEKENLERVAPYTAMLRRIEGYMLEVLNTAGADSIKTPHGTVYKSMRTSATVSDRQAFLDFVLATKLYELLESRVSKLAAQAIIAETQKDIPGVETSSELVINVRRASASGK